MTLKAKNKYTTTRFDLTFDEIMFVMAAVTHGLSNMVDVEKNKEELMSRMFVKGLRLSNETEDNLKHMEELHKSKYGSYVS